MARLPPEAFQACFAAWTREVAALTEGEVVAIDGKRLRRSYDRRNGREAIHMVSAWAGANRLALGQVATEEKSNQMTAIPRLLELLDLRGCLVTLDAMGCQKDLARCIVEKEADYVLAVKGNQASLHQAIREYFETAEAADFRHVPASYFEEFDAGHGRCEVRRYWLVNDLSTLPQPQAWANVQSIGRGESERHQGDQICGERRYYITTLQGEASTFAHAVRTHWGIENQCHWILDVTFREDDSRIRNANAPINFNTLRQLALNLLKRAQPSNSIKQKRFKAALNDDFRAKVVFQQ